MSLIFNMLQQTLKLNSRLLQPLRCIHVTKVQCLYSPSALGIDGYLQSRKNIKERFLTHTQKFKSKMSDFVSDDKSMIFTEDLKNMIHLAEPSDLDLLVNMIKKFNSQNTGYRFGSFVFGPVVMRMFHFLDAPNEALKCFEDPANDGFFDQLITYQILLDLLYNHEMYDDMYRVFDKVQTKQINMSKYPKYPIVLVLAACYKQNTQKSMEYASKLWIDLTSTGNSPLRRAATYFAALALNQGAPHVAVEVISALKPTYVTVRNLKAVALAEAGRLEESLKVLRSVLDIDDPIQKDKHTFFEESITKVKQAVDKSKDKDVKQEFENIEKALKDRNLLTDQTLDHFLNFEISPTKRSPDQQFLQKKRTPYNQYARSKNLS